MINCDNQIRLTAAERQQLHWLTGADTGHIRTRDELERFIKDQLNHRACSGPGACLARRVLASYLYR
jgi:hypothetical protein